MTDLEKNVCELVASALKEDVGDGDRTTSCLVEKGLNGIARITAKEDLVLAGYLPVEKVYGSLSPEIMISFKFDEGAFVKQGDMVCEIRGPFDLLLTGERTALNFFQHLSGIATVTHLYVEKVKPYNTVLLDTRKTIPGWRLLEKAAVCAGGGTNHRVGLYDAILIKDNHIEACGGVKPAVEKAIRLREDDMKVEVEVKNLSELKEAISAGPDMIMLDNMTCDEMKQAVEIVDAKIPLEASGNVNLSTIADIAATGVTYISVGAITHSARAVDLSMLIERVE
jgi:nicotinate-nucleotide pyrophosphorylase (carboxylating)